MEKLNGVVETHYDNGQLKSRETYKNGNFDGLWENWDRDGKLSSSAMFNVIG